MKPWVLLAALIILAPWVLWGVFALLGRFTGPFIEWRDERAFQRNLAALRRECETSPLPRAPDDSGTSHPIAK